MASKDAFQDFEIGSKSFPLLKTFGIPVVGGFHHIVVMSSKKLPDQRQCRPLNLEIDEALEQAERERIKWYVTLEHCVAKGNVAHLRQNDPWIGAWLEPYFKGGRSSVQAALLLAEALPEVQVSPTVQSPRAKTGKGKGDSPDKLDKKGSCSSDKLDKDKDKEVKKDKKT